MRMSARKKLDSVASIDQRERTHVTYAARLFAGVHDAFEPTIRLADNVNDTDTRGPLRC